MPLNIKKKETHEAARRLAELTGESLTEAVDKAVRERLARLSAAQDQDKQEAWRRIRELQRQLAEAPTYDSRSMEEIMEDMYDEYGLPK
jgi:antitoxin VapB